MARLKIVGALLPCVRTTCSLSQLRSVLTGGKVITATSASTFFRAALAVAVFSLLAACASSTTASGPDEAYVKEAWAYFKKKCETEAGEKIYKTFTGVKSVLVVKPLPPATEKDLYDQFWMGDPYSDVIPHADRGGRAARRLIGRGNFKKEYDYANTAFEFIEQHAVIEGTQSYRRIYPQEKYPFFTSMPTTMSVSRFGISWEDISSPEGRKYWVAGSRLRILDLTDNSVVAERIGFLIEPGFGSTAGQRHPWMTAWVGQNKCPLIDSMTPDRLFVLKVLHPTQGESNGK